MKYTKNFNEAKKWLKEEGGNIRWSEERQMYYISVL